jgi:adenylosuccinate synthase
MVNFIIPGRASVVVGGQFGSEAKGLVAAYLALSSTYKGKLICTTNAGAQAGHTTILDDGRKFVCYHLPTIGVLRTDSIIYLNAGSIVDPDLLAREIIDISAVTGEHVFNLAGRIVVHPRAAIITTEAKEIEAMGAVAHLGSTQKGVGAALTNKIMRRPYSVAKGQLDHLEVSTGEIDLMQKMDENYAVTVEIPQGTGLSINAAPFWPKCTSRDCWLMSGLNDAAIHSDYLGEVAMVVRTFPIRVGHIYSGEDVVGHSGEFYPDSVELDWEIDFPGVEPERTTVTKRVRRIASWSWQQYKDALRLNRPTMLFLTFTNYAPEGGYASLGEFVDMLRSRAFLELSKHEVKPFRVYVSDAPNVGSIKEA